MVTFELRGTALNSEDGESILGFKETRSHACYMVYGILKSGEAGRRLKPGKGHEEIVVAMKGDLEVTGARTGTLPEGSAFHLSGDEECRIENRGASEATYLIAGGHSQTVHH